MWPTSRGYLNPTQPSAKTQQPNSQTVSKSLASVDTNQLADSLRTLFGDNISPNLIQSIRDNPSANRVDTSLSPMTSRMRPQERHVIDYESPNYSRLDRSRLSQMSSDFGSAQQRFNDSPPLRAETRIFDPSKMPQKSILKKTKDQSFDTTNFHNIEEEDVYLYGNPNLNSEPSGGLPPGIVPMEMQNEIPSDERSLSPISLRLKREMEKIDRSRRQSEPNDGSHWTPSIGMSGSVSAEEPIRRTDWNDEEEVFKRRYRDLMNPSPDASLELEKVRIQQMAAIQAGILTQTDKTNRRRELSPNSPLRNSVYSTYRRSSPEMSPKRVRRRSPSVSPALQHRKRSISPRRRSRSPRRRSISPRRRSISPRSRRGRRSRSRSRDRHRRSRSRSRTPPRRRSPDPSTSQMNPINPMPPMMRMSVPGMPFMPPHHNIVGMPMGPIIGQYMRPPQMGVPYQAFIPQNIRPNIPNNISPKQRQLRDVPLDNSPRAQPKKPLEKKEDKLLNPHDLLVAERAKLRDELEELKKQLQRKKDEQDSIAKKDGGTDCYAYRLLDRTLKDLRNDIESKHEELIKNFELINEVQKSKSKAKAVMEQLKASGDISKVDLKKKENAVKSKSSPPKKNKWPEKKSEKEEPKQNKKEEIDEDEEDEKNSRFHYFDSGPHWCKDCNKFVDNMKLYFSHIHSKDHLSKQKDSMKTPWATKDYIREMDKHPAKSKDQLVVASKGIHFILPTHGFFCELCEQFLHDSYQAEKHFRSAKHNRSYTRYTLLHNEYEHKWKAERDRAFTEMKKKERELEKEQSKKAAEKKIADRKRLEEEIKRKDREVKEKIEAMNKSLKSIKELDDPKAGEQKKEDKTKSSPKSSIRLNLSSGKNSNESTDKSKSSEKNSEKRDKPKDKSKEKSTENKFETSGESMDTSEGIEDMLVIDEINCDSVEENNENQESNENIDENRLLLPENCENNTKSDSKSNGTDENSDKPVKITIELADISREEDKQMNVEENCGSVENTIETNAKNDQNSDIIEGVVPKANEDKDLDSAVPKNDLEQTSEVRPESCDDSNRETDSEDKTNEEMVLNSEENTANQSTDRSKPDLSNGCPDSRPMTYAEAVAKGPDGQESEGNGLKPVEVEVRSPERLDNRGFVDTEEPEYESKSNLLDTNAIKTEKLFDFDSDIENFNERLKNLDSMVKKESIEGEVDEDDPLDGFDVIDETHNEDTKEIIDLSD